MREKYLKHIEWIIIAAMVVAVIAGVIIYKVHQAAEIDDLSRNLHF